ncbi:MULTISPECIES: ABC transporter ATP-binding protein [unclassified Oleiphilus]|jgi:putative ABC transport system ATP-binding protein|nr:MULTISPECIES: ABC transporter ATP-binding protein [unclassified Oleiphilus]KZY45857.1 methionine ABC transporter ATP-binding protein [Oleiphilus sp. HI0050]KZY64288.1 methionine ABC transporter ATP-binding protein [Oleiphilus sp. HI0061]KZY73566.1 methionine ABC transporter ATP-binding protein [Oleiphilus sp. HI0068]KZY87965.1 methionine ABC transporter ATP-binding protein [Oleiphilus sp. HI0069]KZY89070.1 methionine ABC transporter ATP-binding protein [Oleiphilus sp. HI0072]KZZ09548.1 met
MDAKQVLLKVDNLRFRWPSGQRDVLDIPKFEVLSGEGVFIKGESGTGKTTLLSLIGGINLPDAGCIEVLGTDISKLRQSRRDHFRADHIGFIFQLFNLIPYLSVIENITLACKFSKLRTQRVLAKSGSLEEEAYRLLSQLQLNDRSMLTRKVSDLSVGQQQRVAAARALIGSPELIIADEPTSALDADTREHFIQLLLEECKQSGATILFVSHDAGLEAAFDRSIQLGELNRACEQSSNKGQEAVL